MGGVDGVQVRTVGAADIAALEQVLPSDGDHARQLANAVAGRRAFLLAWSGGGPVGVVAVQWSGVRVDDGDAVPEIGSLAVVPAWRGRGVGRTLMIAAERVVRERGGTATALLVAEDNPAARRLYERLDYRDTGRRRYRAGEPGSGGVPELLLYRRLPD